MQLAKELKRKRDSMEKKSDRIMDGKIALGERGNKRRKGEW